MAITVSKFSKKFPGEQASGHPKAFCFLICFKITLPEKTACKKFQNQNLVPPLQKTKNFEYAYETFLKSLFTPAYFPV